MKLKEDFIVHRTDGECFLVPTGASGFSGMVRGNKTLGAMLELLRTETSEEAMVSAMKARFRAPEDMIARDVARALSELRKIGAIEE